MARQQQEGDGRDSYAGLKTRHLPRVNFCDPTNMCAPEDEKCEPSEVFVLFKIFDLDLPKWMIVLYRLKYAAIPSSTQPFMDNGYFFVRGDVFETEENAIMDAKIKAPDIRIFKYTGNNSDSKQIEGPHKVHGILGNPKMVEVV